MTIKYILFGSIGAISGSLLVYTQTKRLFNFGVFIGCGIGILRAYLNIPILYWFNHLLLKN